MNLWLGFCEVIRFAGFGSFATKNRLPRAAAYGF
jgi:nucleoid DNA-binding protein